MKLYNIIFFAGEGEEPVCEVAMDKEFIEDWPVTIHITDSKDKVQRHIAIHTTHQGWLTFKNSVLAADRQIIEGDPNA